MAFIPVPNVVQGELLFQVGTTLCENTLYFRKETSIQDSDPESVALDLYTWWAANMKAIQPATVALVKTMVKDISAEDSFYGEYSANNEPGTKFGTILPMNCSCVVKFSTSRSGRSYRGRNYFIGLTEADVAGDGVATDIRNNIYAAYEQLRDDLGTNGWTQVVVSRYHAGAPRTTGISTQVESVSISAIVNSQRRRLSGVGM